MKHAFDVTTVRWVAVVFSCVVCCPATGEEPVRYGEQILPLLSKNCFACHGLDEGARQADLRLDVESDANESRAIVPGSPEQSELVTRITSDSPDTVMPPPDSGQALTPDEIALLRLWIAQGAQYEKHWAFVPPVKAELPEAGNLWSVHPIDRFVLQRLKREELEPNREEDRSRLIRRVTLDLIGLPPTVDEVTAFINDDSVDAYELAVDRLLSRAAFGEHWARLWLDLARYADTKGYEKDRGRTIWRYRDWVIDAFNRDLPYDQFTIEQIAGDLIPNATEDQILATAFHRNTMENEEGGTDDEEFRVAAVKDRVDTTFQVWMGLTIGCAKCHSHKYDPISQQDYYAVYDFFNQTEDADREGPVMATPTPEQRKQLEQLERDKAKVQEQLASAVEDVDEAFTDWMKQFESRPLWSPLSLHSYSSAENAVIEPSDGGDLVVAGELPEKDTLNLTFDLPEGIPLTAMRLDVFPKEPGGKWNDKNVVISELKVELIEEGGESVEIKLARPRADFSQQNWHVSQALDGKVDSGWAFSPQASEQHCAVFDFAEPIVVRAGQRLRLTVDQRYGQGLVLKKFRFSTSGYPTDWLAPSVNFNGELEEIYKRRINPETAKLYAMIDAIAEKISSVRRSVVSTPIMRELPQDKLRKTRVHVRGNFLEQGEEVVGRVPAAFGELVADAPKSRLGVAHWLVDASNPLTARVAVNRVWAQLFGMGIVETEEDFGTQGTLPSHPELLDWMAVDFVENGWSLKKLVKTIVMSKAYRQSSSVTDEVIVRDPNNRLISRGPRFRLSAEMVRDQALAVSGLLTDQVGGPSVMPPQPDGIWKSTYSGEKWKNATGADRYRRAIYTYKKRTSPYPAMTTFDSGSGEVCQVRRVRTNTPLQALVTLNDTLFVEAAGALGLRMEEASTKVPEQIAHGFQRVLMRPAEPEELDRLVELYKSLGKEITDGADLLRAAGRTEGDPILIAVANVLLNLDETLMKP